MVNLPSEDKDLRLIIEKMRFSEPRILILYGLFAIVLYIILASFGGFHYKIDIYIMLILLFYVAFVIRGLLNKIHEFLEIGDKTQELSPLRNLFVSKEAFLNYRNKIVNIIFSKWQLYFSILFLISFAIVVVFDTIIKHNFDKPFTIPEILITLLSYYFSWWIIIFPFLSLIWALFWFIIGFLWLKDAEGLKLNESIKFFKSLKNNTKNDENALNRSLEGYYYTYNGFVTESIKITDLSFYIAVRVAIIAVLISVNWIWVLGFMYNDWQLPQISIVIFIDIMAVFIFIIPQIIIHKILKSAKLEILNIINDIYELNKMCEVVRYASFSQIEESSIKNLKFLKGVVNETKNLKTWQIDLQAVIRLTAAIISTVLPLLTKLKSHL